MSRISTIILDDKSVVRRTRAKDGFAQAGLLVLTPSASAEGEQIDKAVTRHRRIGPTLVITPKWAVVPARQPGAPKGWVQLVGQGAPRWPGFLDDVAVDLHEAPAATDVLEEDEPCDHVAISRRRSYRY